MSPCAHAACMVAAAIDSQARTALRNGACAHGDSGGIATRTGNNDQQETSMTTMQNTQDGTVGDELAPERATRS